MYKIFDRHTLYLSFVPHWIHILIPTMESWERFWLCTHTWKTWFWNY